MTRIVALLLLSLAGGPAWSEPPSIVLIVADDLGWNDVGYHNTKMRTPNLDTMAAGGVRLNQHYVMPQCTPTRVALMTGRYPSRFGPHCCSASNEQAYPIGTPTMASVLKQAGYATALAGKWHMGSKPEWGPNHYGFDSSYGSLAGAIGMYDHRYRLNSPFARTWHRDHEFIDEVGHATDLVADEAVRVIHTHTGGPLFLYVPFQSVHTPLVEEPIWLDANRHHKNTDRMLYGAAVTHMDHCIGKVLRAIGESSMAKNTLVVFTSDNGAVVNSRGGNYPAPDPQLRNFSSNAPLRSIKTHVFEGGIRVPALAYFPGRLRPHVCNAPLHAIDWLPTLAKLAEFQGGLPEATDGQDVWPAINGDQELASQLKQRELYWVWGQNRNRVAIRRGDWKLLRDRRGDKWQLFNVAHDPNEKNDLASSEPDRVQAMKQAIRDQRSKDRLAN